MDKVVYQNQNKGKLFKNNSGGSVQTELAATGNIFDANQNKYKVALIKEVYNGDQNNARRYLYLRVGVAFPNKSDKEKLVIGEGVAQNSAGSGNAPERRELSGKWDNKSDSITSIQVDSKNGSFAAGTRLKVWGSD